MTAQIQGEFDLASVVAARTRGLLAERRMKQGDLASAMGIARSGINNRLTGAKDFDINELPALADILDTTVEYLLGMTDVRESKNPRPGDVDGGDSLAVRHQGLEPRTRWLVEPARTLSLVPAARLIPAPLPPEPAEEPAPAVAVLTDRRRTSNSSVRGSSRIATVTSLASRRGRVA